MLNLYSYKHSTLLHVFLSLLPTNVFSHTVHYMICFCFFTDNSPSPRLNMRNFSLHVILNPDILNNLWQTRHFCVFALLFSLIRRVLAQAVLHVILRDMVVFAKGLSHITHCTTYCLDCYNLSFSRLRCRIFPHSLLQDFDRLLPFNICFPHVLQTLFLSASIKSFLWTPFARYLVMLVNTSEILINPNQLAA